MIRKARQRRSVIDWPQLSFPIPLRLLLEGEEDEESGVMLYLERRGDRGAFHFAFVSYYPTLFWTDKKLIFPKSSLLPAMVTSEQPPCPCLYPCVFHLVFNPCPAEEGSERAAGGAPGSQPRLNHPTLLCGFWGITTDHNIHTESDYTVLCLSQMGLSTITTLLALAKIIWVMDHNCKVAIVYVFFSQGQIKRYLLSTILLINKTGRWYQLPHLKDT